ncbi:MAG: hypothetical protein AAGA24_07180 [Pseudomonadota bacterium]
MAVLPKLSGALATSLVLAGMAAAQTELASLPSRSELSHAQVSAAKYCAADLAFYGESFGAPHIDREVCLCIAQKIKFSSWASAYITLAAQDYETMQTRPDTARREIASQLGLDPYNAAELNVLDNAVSRMEQDWSDAKSVCISQAGGTFSTS